MDEYAKKHDMDSWIAEMDRWQKLQNGSIQRIEAKVDEIHKGQLDFYPSFYKLMETEVDRRRCDDAELSGRIDGLDKSCGEINHRLDLLEVMAKLPGWTWKAVAAVLTLTVAVLTILSLSHVI